MNRRILGLETEYGLTCSDSSGAHVAQEPAVIAEHMFAHMRDKSGATSVFLGNGARLYLDVGDHPEYATAECTTIAELLAQDRAGDQVVAQLARRAEETLGVRVHLLKNNVDTAQHSYGCHENYSVRRRRDFLDRLEQLVPFFITRQLLVGAGYLHHEPGTVRFEVSQRARHIHGTLSTSSTSHRPMINTRDEPHADAEKYRRLHVIVGDSNMCEATIALKIGMTHAVLSMLEDGQRFPKIALADPMKAIRDTAQDLRGAALLELEDGSQIQAREVQQIYYDQVCQHYQTNGGWGSDQPLFSYAMDLWGRGLAALESGDFQPVETELEWVAKYRLMQKYRQRYDVSLRDDRLSRLELAWHDISPAGLRNRLEQTNILRRVIPASDVEHAMNVAPQTSRARVRADFIHAAHNHHRDYAADWASVTLFDGTTQTQIPLKDPFATADEQVAALIARMEQQ